MKGGGAPGCGGVQLDRGGSSQAAAAEVQRLAVRVREQRPAAQPDRPAVHALPVSERHPRLKRLRHVAQQALPHRLTKLS